MIIWATYFSIPSSCARVAASDLRRKFTSQFFSSNNCFSPSAISKRPISGALPATKSSLAETSGELEDVRFFTPAVKQVFY
jgi:hypothetical protein